MSEETPIDRAEHREYPYDHLHSPLQSGPPTPVNAKRATMRREATGPAAAAEYLDDEAKRYDLED